MVAIREPVELLEMDEGEARTLYVARFERGDLVINPRDGRPPKTVQVIRAHVIPSTKPFGPAWWDLTSATLVAQVGPILEARTKWPAILRLTAQGVAPRRRYQVEVVG